MATGRKMKRIPNSSKYKYVALLELEKGYTSWQGCVLGKSRHFKTEREAAKWVDLRLIDKGKEPVNILVRK